MGEGKPIKLQMKDISIEFPGVKALKNVDFMTMTGTSHALIGANGAGKSTLMKVLSGAYGHYTGEIYIDDEPVQIRNPKDAKDLGIQIVYQEVDTALVPYLTVGENIMLDYSVNDMGKKQVVSWGYIHKRSKEILDKMNVKVPSKKLVSELTLAEKQMVLIARAISKTCRFLILDEPTAPLSHSETEELFRIVRDLKQEHVGVIFISHRLPELFEICDDITVMRDGEFVVNESMREINQNQVVEYMLGRKLGDQFPQMDIQKGETIFEIRNFSDGEKVHDINIHAKRGEIIGIAGLVGAGKTELCKALFGLGRANSGDIILHGKKLRLRSPHDAVKQGIALVPEERRKEGILVGESVATNLTAVNLKKFSRMNLFLNFKKEKEAAREIIQNLGIKTPGENVRLQNLSGGNQQKVAIGKWLMTEAEVYIFDEPTKGVDVGAKKDIFELIFQLAQRGKCIIYASCELSEMMGITDRMYVLYDGMIAKELQTSETNEEEILFYSTGGK
ncbi:ATP-binding cassette domain-containing protein [Paenibacillus sp. HJL G12]|uniref:ATP-binding cassette domain-containing protein n=1 Tax=Paenibacillus dendrobii TaxID=2691084 RepID=A0A7X3LF43_9BACL|nr:sugar ABC transporter ATP-binding protein [Paenibacillus dendrobii]MWV43236.1 ATP-binding cassette domain-containing protein [Paenibacillus dendrobii]